MNKIGIDLVKNLYDYVIHDQKTFNKMFVQVTPGTYKVKNGVRSVFVNTGSYSYEQLLAANDDETTPVVIEANELEDMYLEPDVVFNEGALSITVPVYPTGAKVHIGDVPTAADDPGKPGEVRADATTLYVCVAENEWVKATLATWT